MNLRSTVLGAGMRHRFQGHVDRQHLSAAPSRSTLVTDDAIAYLPEPAQRYLQFMRVVGRPRDWSFRSRFVGEFRMRPGQAFMPCDAWQYNSALGPARVYYMRIDVGGVVPMFGTDVYRGGHGRMHGKVLGLVTVAEGSGAEFDISELTTYVNDALSLAPSMLLIPEVTWTPVDDSSFDVTMVDAGLTSTSRVLVDGTGRLVEISTTDRWAASPAGLTRAPWSTPVDGWVDHAGRWLPTGGHAIWHFDDGPYEYARGRFLPDTVEFNVAPDHAGDAVAA